MFSFYISTPNFLYTIVNIKYNKTITEIERNMLGIKFIFFKKQGNVIKKDKEGIIIANTP